MHWHLDSPAVVRQGETSGALTLVFEDIPGDPPGSFTAKWKLCPWNGEVGGMADYVAATVSTPVEHESPHTGEEYWSVVLDLPKNLLPADFAAGLYYLSIQFLAGAAIEYPLPKRAIAVTVEEEFAVA